MKSTLCFLNNRPFDGILSVRAFARIFVGICLILSGMSSLEAQTDGETVEELVADTISSDTLLYVDSSQPRVRAGVYLGPTAATALLRDVPLNPSLAPGFIAGIRSELEFAAPLYFLLEAELTDRRLYSSPQRSGSVTRWDFHFWYFQFPILFQLNFPFGDGPNFTAGFGAVPSIVLSRKQILGGEGFRDTTLALDTGVQNFDFGFEFRVGTEWSLGSNSALTLDIRYLLGLQNILILATREDPRVWKARTVGLSVGWVYQLQRPIYRE